MTTISSNAVECAPHVPPRLGDDVRAGAACAAAFACARSDVSVKTILTLFRDNPWALPVVDGQGRFLGFVSCVQARALRLPPRLALAIPVGELLFGHTLMVPEARTLRRTLHAMALHRTRVMALLDGGGILRGVLRDIDALHALLFGVPVPRP